MVIRSVPVALLGTACAAQPWTPSVPVAYWSQPVPDAGPVMAQSGDLLLRRWALPETDAWAPYQKATLLTAVGEMDPGTLLPDTERLDVVQVARASAHRVATAGLPSDVMVVVDLRGAASVAFGAELVRASRAPVSLVLTFNNWPSEDEVVPAEETLAALVRDAPLSQAGGGPPVFLLDAWRLAFRFDEPDPGSVDNRYAVGDLPTADVLRARGIRRVLYVVEDLDETDVEEDDLNATFLAYQAAGIPVSMTDLDFMSQRELALSWPAVLDSCILQVSSRQVIVDDPYFYARAHGGWGGVRGLPGGWGGHGRWGGHGFHGGGHGGG
ncbi:MAG TPA: hypothetical protein VLM85_10100 [Polyangiaceae bacterium]|nr:hypothetical protein [Polyangiaceae bacterium]